ncbi:hypothetical protein O181_034944 [Austropuccinia psidii MF-1]|uniref:Uncharacterized protein n=1 Tax=Austropuccinia psidii MF-1 TaxID=1389203 RepID=A0A9Q3D1Q5_9BASI|nr:hypothetical protein [Austropuccinia psidii MF-1]
MRPKGAKGEPSSYQGQVGPKPQLDPPEPILAINPLDTKMAIEPVGRIFGHGTLFQPWPLATTRGHQTSSASFSLKLGVILSTPPCTAYSRLQEWCIYGIIYHYAPFLLSNSMVTFSGPNPTIPNKGPKIQRPFSKEDSLTHQSRNPWRQSEDHSRIPITWFCRSWGGNFIQDYSKGILRGYTVFQSVFKASSISILLGQLNCSMKALINQPVCPWFNWGNSIFHCGNSITQFNYKMARTVLAQFRQYSW